ncbi:MAG: DMT family transporter [Pseudomonadota bacterium]
MQRKDRIDLFGGTILVVFSILLGLNQALIKIVNGGFQPVFQAGLRSACAFVPLLLFALLTRKRLSLTDGSFWPGLVCGGFFAAEFLLLFLALDYTTVARASVFMYSMPFWVAIGAHVLIPGERLTPVRLAGLALAMVGIVWALLDDAAPATPNAIWGDLASLVAAMFWAGIALMVRTTRLSRATPVMQLLYQLCVSGIVLIAVAPIFGDLIREPTPLIFGIFAFQVLVIISIGFTVWLWVLSVYPASDMASFGFLAPLFGVLFGWLLLDEPITSAIVGGLALVSVGIILINRRP